jgi:hypothetical protein
VFQSLVAGAVFLLTTCCGIHVGYSAILLPQLKAVNSTLPTDNELGSWIGETPTPHTPFDHQIIGLQTSYGAVSFPRFALILRKTNSTMKFNILQTEIELDLLYHWRFVLATSPLRLPTSIYFFNWTLEIISLIWHPLWREDGPVVYNCWWSSPAQSLSGPSPAGLMTTFYCFRFETPPIWRARSLYLYPPGTG